MAEGLIEPGQEHRNDDGCFESLAEEDEED